MTMRRAGLEAVSATTLRRPTGELLDLDLLPPGLIKKLVSAEARKAVDMLAMVKESKDDS